MSHAKARRREAERGLIDGTLFASLRLCVRFLLSRRASVAASLLLAWACGAPPARALDPAVYEPNADPGVGFNLVSWWNFGGSGANVWRNAVQSVYDSGFREVSLSPVRFVDPATGVIATSSQQGPELAHVAAGLERAKSLGMRVTVNPFVEVQGFAYWRGQYDPTPGTTSWSAFWDDYRQYLVDVAQMAEAGGADALNVGTEL